MDENEILQQETPEEEADGFLTGWEETGEAEAAQEAAEETADLPGEAPPEEDAPPAEEAESAPEDTPPAENPPPPPKTWTLNRQGQPLTVGETEIAALAQRGLEYDRLRAEYDGSRPVVELMRRFAQDAGLSLEDYTARLRAQAKQAQGLDAASARQQVELEDREARVAAQEAAERQRQAQAQQFQARQAQQRERIQRDVQEFASVFPDAARDFRNLPGEVWQAVDGGMSLVAAYARYSAAQAQAEARAQAEEQARQEAVLRQNAENAARSAGSMKSAGQNHGPKDPFLDGFDED